MDQPTSQQVAASEPKQNSAAKNFFLYFLAFALLYTVAFNFGALLFQIINKSFPLVGEYGSGFSASSLRFSLAALIIGTPIFLWLSKTVHTHAATDPVARNSGIRRWLTYITMILTALIVIGDLIALVNNLLSGETTLRFILKAVVVLLIAVAIFYYYLTDIKEMKADTEAKNALPRIYFIGTAIIVLVSIVAGFFFIESPTMQRLRKEDQARLNNLQIVESGIYQYANLNGTLPTSMDAIEIYDEANLDPVTKKPFTYTVTGPTTYELCATFVTSNKEVGAENYYGPDWLHDTGETCFKRTIVSQIPDAKALPPLR